MTEIGLDLSETIPEIYTVEVMDLESNGLKTALIDYDKVFNKWRRIADECANRVSV